MRGERIFYQSKGPISLVLLCKEPLSFKSQGVLRFEFPQYISDRNVRLDELNDEINDLIAEQVKIAETLHELIGDMETS